ncbi:MAG TPA: transferrin receptor-like dimerization domain-containing protein [Terriglobales bacterium]|nr:transferrin receptor-like dimerization domain-containing protein [Terriglobales bacterium]
MRRLLAISLSCSLLISTLWAQGPQPNQDSILGFTAASSATERGWEQKFKAIPKPELMKQYMQRLSARPHHVGSPYDKDNAEWILSQLKSFGWDAKIEQFDVLFPTPKTRVLEMTEPTRFTAKLEEPTLPNDPTSGQKQEQLPTYNAYSPDGDVTAPLVFVNYGLPADYEQLERLGVSVKGAIVIAKYGNSWRGVKPRVAWEHGAIGCLIYSDPRDDGYFEDRTFPEGPMRPKDGVQRGSVMDFPHAYPGDPLTPGIGATADAKRLTIKEAKNLAQIPTLPISYGDAQPLLAALTGPMAPEAWRGGLPIPYHVGAGPTKVHLKLEFDWKVRPVYDVVGRLAGSSEADQWVVRGNHHDAWVNGAEDPTSGQVSLLEEARALGEIYKQGWRPKRTIIYAAWDGEEPMLLGSTEWGEQHAQELQQHGVAYVNTDGNGRGFLQAEGAHSLEALVNGVARDIDDPESGMSVWKRLQAARIYEEKNADARAQLRQRADWKLAPLGSGTDYTVFQHHLGVPSLNLGFYGEDDGGIYHSIYDDFYWFTHFSDTDFIYGRALAQTIGTTVMRLADADVLPYRFTNLSDAVNDYLKEVQNLLKQRQDEVKERNRQLDDNVFKAVNDPRRPTVAPKREEVPPHINFAPLENAADALARAGEHYNKALSTALVGNVDATRFAALNEKLLTAERLLLNPDGLPTRPYYKHMLYAPGLYTGYAPKTVSGIRESIELKDYKLAESEVPRVAKAVSDEAAFVESIAKELEQLSAK